MTFGLSFAVAAIAGVLIGPLYFVSFDMGDMVGLKAFSAAVFGGINSIPGTILGGVVIGLLENLAGGYISSAYKDLVAFVILLVMLVVAAQRTARTRDSGQGVNGVMTPARWLAIGAALLALLAVPAVAPHLLVHIATFVADLYAAGHRTRFPHRLHRPGIARAGRASSVSAHT